MCSTGVMKSAWAYRSAGAALQSTYVAARTIAKRDRRCEKPVELSEQSLEDQGTQDSEALVKTKSKREEFVTAPAATER